MKTRIVAACITRLNLSFVDIVKKLVQDSAYRVDLTNIRGWEMTRAVLS